MNYLYFCFKKSFILFCTVFSFYSSLNAMMLDEFEGELSYNVSTNTTMCKCRFNPSQSQNSTFDNWEKNWKPNVVTGLTMGFTFLVLDDLLNYDFDKKTCNSRIIGCICGICALCKNYYKKHDKNKVNNSLDKASGAVAANNSA